MKKNTSVDNFYEYGIDTSNRILYLGSESFDSDGGEGGIDFLLAEKAIKGLIVLDTSAPEGDKPMNNNQLTTTQAVMFTKR